MADRSFDEILGDRYLPLERIATGGMGEVWRAHDQVLHRDVAVKILKRELADDPDCRVRFLNEARSAGSLHHPGVAAVFDFGEIAGEPPFLVMELLKGETLSELLRLGPLEPERARDFVAQTASALGEAHRAGLVHRDVKPGNIIVLDTGAVKLTDFGIARAADSVALTKTGEVIGTPTYLSPEQAEGRTATVASDVYSLGVVLFECLTGRRPFVADSPVGTALAHIREPIPELPDDIPADLADVTRRALAKDPDLRYPDGDAMAAALLGAPDPTMIIAAQTARPAAVPPAPLSATNRRWALLAVAGLAALVVIVLLVALLTDGSKDPATPGSETPSQTPSARVRVAQAAYLDKPLAEVRAALKALGFTTTVAASKKPNPGGHTAGTVAGLTPNGSVLRGKQIVITVWAAPASSGDDGGDDDPGKGPKKPRGKGPKN